MADATHISYNASDRSYYAILKKEIHNIAVKAGFNEKKIAELDIIIAELTSNLHKYTNGGDLLIGYFDTPGDEYIEVLSLDSGPGIADVNKVLADGYSTTNTMGHGLGSIKRFSDEFDIYSLKSWGTIVLSRVYKEKRSPKIKPQTAVEVKPLIVMKPGETTSGDGFYLKTGEGYVKLLIADGLGHGPDANHAVNTAVASFKQCPFHSPAEIIRFLHRDIRKTRGIVGTIVVYDIKNRVFKITGVGNIASKLFGRINGKSILAYNGIIGHNIPNTMNDQQMGFTEYQQMIFCSDGIKSRWDTNRYTGINRCDGTILAAAIYKDFARQTDDMSVIVVKVK